MTVAPKPDVAAPAPTTIRATAPKRVRFRKKFKVSVTVSSADLVPTGTVELYRGNRLIGRGTLADGKVRIKTTKNLKRGRHTIAVVCVGSPGTLAGQTSVKVRVKRR